MLSEHWQPHFCGRAEVSRDLIDARDHLTPYFKSKAVIHKERGEGKKVGKDVGRDHGPQVSV